MTAMNQFLAKLLYLSQTFFQFHLCYENQVEKKHWFSQSKPKIELLCLSVDNHSQSQL